MNDTALVKTRTRANAQTETNLDQISRGSLAVMGGLSALIGLWAVACFVGAMITGGGPLAVAASWFQAVAGM